MVVAICSKGLSFLKDSCKDILQAFERYKDKITIVINLLDFFDGDEKENMKNNIIQYFQIIGIQSFIFALKQDSGERLCKLFDQEIKYSQPQKIKFTETEMLALIKCDDLEQFEEPLVAQIYQSSDTFWQLREMTINNQNQDKFLMVLKQLIKNVIEEFQNKFNKLDILHKKEDQQAILYQHCKFILIDYLNCKIAHQKEHKIELQNFIENELRPFDKKFEQGLKICIQKIRDEAKKKKINYL
ncbi:unnamed protein product (macronuclear) [Paramecium tetraurelia]|uniref:Uncharacterized protein n=1 Tax=Paramecium tetraurelia TaxID=5888 RepID=A0E4N6_PARTE|nr:uncharacterized protein GSPATT00023428001 [Paramecium tetraurelia]CAK90253.1 unnamed protein product [Paramecium tetraurelia]|eukprot:XP_001457650.1 hypothetical protein (macronuclear) [Paramecium tetraurelia strain d4-2]